MSSTAQITNVVTEQKDTKENYLLDKLMAVYVQNVYLLAKQYFSPIAG